MASLSSSHLAALIQEVLRASPGAARLCTQALEEIQSPIILGTDEIDAASSGADKYLQFLMGALEYAISPHARSPLFREVYRDFG